jgi:hypothetical protein
MALAVTSGSSRKARPVSLSLTAANTQRPRKEEAQAHIGLSSHGYYYIIVYVYKLNYKLLNNKGIQYKYGDKET